ncbi:unnamed protein product [Clonostachys rhizophaga]|uniref:Uncharacterized protein n=1 Tax=Clonostachys rhizophaga TaxID=160324 RepID=A0A9N9VDN7_9HYPO|nr:unnamed protein product [Clonostachys rhizophaga]
MGGEKLPETPSEWATGIRTARHLLPNVSPHKLSLDGVKRLASASVLEFDDWLLLKILSILDQEKPTPTIVLGSKVGPRLEKAAREYLERQTWWQAVLSRSNDLDDWGAMEAWKKAYLDITARGKVIQYERPEYDLENLFAYKVSVEPASGSSPCLTPEPVCRPRPAAIAGQSTRRDSDVASAQIAEEHGFELPLASPVAGSQYSPGKVSVSSISHRLANRPPDEALVNKAVIDLLQGISMKHPLIRDKYDWSIIHQTFHVFQQRERKEKIMTSRTDGCLQVLRQGELLEACPTLAIIEAKPIRRKIKQVPISMQEGAEMAAWISTESLRGLLPGSDPNGIMRRVLISQDFDEICITVAEYDKEYVDYITNGFKSAEMNSTQGSPTAFVQSRQKRPQLQPQQGRAKRHKGHGEGDDGDENDDDESSGGESDHDDGESSGGGSDDDDDDQ